MTKSWRTRQLLPINQLYLAVTGTFFQNLVILVRVYRFRERVLFALPLAALCRAAISIRMRECAPRPCHAIGRKVALCRPMKKKIFLLLLFSPFSFHRARRWLVVEEEDGFFLGNFFTLGEKSFAGRDYDNGGIDEENERILIGLGIWSWKVYLFFLWEFDLTKHSSKSDGSYFFHSDWKFLEMNSKIEKIGFFVKIFSGEEKLYCVGCIYIRASEFNDLNWRWYVVEKKKTFNPWNNASVFSRNEIKTRNFLPSHFNFRIFVSFPFVLAINCYL